MGVLVIVAFLLDSVFLALHLLFNNHFATSTWSCVNFDVIVQ